MEGQGDCLVTASLSVAYNDLSDVWGDLKDDLDAVLPLDQVLLKNKVGNSTRVKHVPVRVLSASSRAMHELEQHRKSSMAWFRLPFAELVCFSCEDYDEYKRNFRLQLRAMVDQETRLPTDPIPIFVYVQPKTVQDPKGPLRVMDAATKELSDRASSFQSVIHMVAGNASGRAALSTSLKEALLLSIEARRAAYHNEASRIILRLIRDITSPVKSDITFSDLYLVKDSSAAMLEAAGLYQDAVTEYTEMEAMIEETFARVLSENPTEEKDAYAYLVSSDNNLPEASQLWQNWFVNRSIVSTAPRGVKPVPKEGRAFIDLVVLPAIKANVIRNLIKDMKIVAALETYMQFAERHRDLLQRFEDVKRCPSNLASAWAFSACIGMAVLVCSPSVRDLGRVFWSRAMEEVEIFSRGSEDEMLTLNMAVIKALKKEERDTSAQLLGKILIIARESLKAIGSSNGFGAPEMTASLEELSRQLDKGFDGSPVSTPLPTAQTPSLAKTPTDSIRVTPQNSLGHDDIRLLHFEESVHLTHEHTISMDNIDLSSQLANVSVSDAPLEQANRPISSEISLHTRDISDSGSGASMSPRVKQDSDKALFQQGQQGDPRPNLSLSLLRLEKEIQKLKKLSCLYISTDDSAQLQETSWKPQYWRLQSCLSSSHAFQNMWKAITAACKQFFDVCGWERNSCLLKLELADVAYLEGNVGTAMEIYTFIVADLLHLKWHTLLVSILQRLALCQVKEKSTGVIWSCYVLMKACRELSATTQELQKCSQMFASSTCLGEPVLPEPWIAHLPSTCMIMNPLLSVRGCTGVFIYDLSRRKASDGCIKAHVGDSVEIAVKCINNLGIPFSLDKVKICLTRLQEMSEISEMMPGRSLASPSLDTPVVVGHTSPLVSPTSPYHDSWRPNVVSHWRDIDEIEGECTDASPVQVKTTETTMHFLVNPIKSGLYKLSYICGFWNEAFIEIQSDDLERQDGQTIMLKVDPPVPRMHVKAATLGNPSLISGEEQWLGIEIELERDSVSHATVNIDWPSRNMKGNKGPGIDAHDSNGATDVLPSQFLFYPKLHSVLVQNLSELDEKRFIAPETGDDILSTTGPASLYAVDFDNESVHALFWWRVNVGHLEVPMEDVRISSYRVRKDNSSKKLHQDIDTKRTLSTINLPVSLLYFDQCSRVASASARITIDQPFQIQTDARELDNGIFLVSLTISSTTEREVQIDSVEIDCQKGFSMSRNMLQESGSLPLLLDPLGSCHASFILNLDASLLDNRAVAQAMVYRTGKLLPSAARIAYSSMTLEETDTNIAMASHSPREQRVEHSFATIYSVFDQTTGPTDNDMDMMMQQEAAAHHHSHLTPKCSHIHRFALQLSSIDTDAYNVFVSVRMLGPFSATIGCPVTLCWQLERVGTCERKALSQISYEIHADSHTWSSTSKDQGRVLLGLTHGSIATIEAQWTPTSLGTLEVPLLRLHDVYYEEVRETGVKKNYVIVRS